MTALPLRIAVRISGAFLLTAIVLVAASLGRAPAWLLLAYLGVGALSAALYGLDKRAATRGDWRTTESTLHTVDLAGGIIGGLAAQALLRHKTSKQEFGTVTGIIATVHALALVGLIVGLYGLG